MDMTSASGAIIKSLSCSWWGGGVGMGSSPLSCHSRLMLRLSMAVTELLSVILFEKYTIQSSPSANNLCLIFLKYTMCNPYLSECIMLNYSQILLHYSYICHLAIILSNDTANTVLQGQY